jgi:IclR helix-turn-helix domain
MSENDQAPITIALSPTQVDAILRAAADERAPSIANIIAGSLARARGDHGSGNRHGDGDRQGNRNGQASGPPVGELFSREIDDPRLSRSLLRGFSLLAGFGPDGAERGIVELANELGMSPSTAHRYALTLVELGLLERCPKTRKYRLPAAV